MTEPAFALTSSRHFIRWLAGTGGGLAFSTYGAGKLFLLGAKPDGNLWVFERSFARCMGLGVSADGRSLLLASEFQLLRLDNVMPPVACDPLGADALFAPHQAWITGDCDIHDIRFGGDGAPLFVNTLFSCLATVSPGYSFRPLWRPAFISRLAAEDRCHLNGVALVDGAPRYVTAVSRSDVMRSNWWFPHPPSMHRPAVTRRWPRSSPKPLLLVNLCTPRRTCRSMKLPRSSAVAEPGSRL